MELKIEAKNLDMRKSWQEKIEEEQAKLIRHYANMVLYLRVTIEIGRAHV
jgi:ribosome-associated translation inhibitor RaiA